MQRLHATMKYGVNCEGSSRLQVNFVLLDRLYEVSKERAKVSAEVMEDVTDMSLNRLKEVDPAGLTDAQRPRPVTPPPPPHAPFVLNTETSMSSEIMYHGEKQLLNGIADYVIAYKAPGEATNVATSLVVVEAKSPNLVDTSYGQLVSYMGG